MKKLLSLVSLVSLIFGSFGLGMQTASAQPLNFPSDTTISFTGSGRTLIVKAGSTAQSLVVNTSNMVVVLEQANTFQVWDTGTDTASGRFRKITASDLTPSACAAGNAASQMTTSSPSGTKTVTITPSDELFSCTVAAAPVSGGGTVSTTTTTTTVAPTPTPTTTPTPADAVYVFKDGKFVAVTKDEAAKLEAEAAAKKTVEVKPEVKEEAKAPTEPTKEEKSAEAPKSVAPQPAPQDVTVARQEQVQNITKIEAPALAQADTIAEVVQNLGVTRDEKKEDKAIENTIPKLDIDLASLFAPTAAPAAPATGKVAISAKALETVVAFVAYGTDTTEKIGEGERAGVLNSYIAACGKAPQNEEEWADVLKIAAGRFPAEKCTKTVSRAQTNFQRVYGRTPKTDNASDQAAITMMQFGLLPVKAIKTEEGAKIVPNRDVVKEKKAITVFRGIFKFSPKAPTAWSVVRAIAYSGAKR